jgi:hypothetical protein
MKVREKERATHAHLSEVSNTLWTELYATSRGPIRTSVHTKSKRPVANHRVQKQLLNDYCSNRLFAILSELLRFHLMVLQVSFNSFDRTRESNDTCSAVAHVRHVQHFGRRFARYLVCCGGAQYRAYGCGARCGDVELPGVHVRDQESSVSWVEVRWAN